MGCCNSWFSLMWMWDVSHTVQCRWPNCSDTDCWQVYLRCGLIFHDGLFNNFCIFSIKLSSVSMIICRLQASSYQVIEVSTASQQHFTNNCYLHLDVNSTHGHCLYNFSNRTINSGLLLYCALCLLPLTTGTRSRPNVLTSLRMEVSSESSKAATDSCCFPAQ